MERCKLRRTSFVDALFEAVTELGDGFGVRLPMANESAFEPSAPLGILSDMADDVLVIPGVIAVDAGSELAQELNASDAFAAVDSTSDGGPTVFRALSGAGVEGVRAVLEVLARSTDSLDRTVAAPVLGFVSHQRVTSSADAESTSPIPSPIRSSRGAGARVDVLDTGLADDYPWRTAVVSAATATDVDPLEGALAPGFLGRSAGHGTFVASLCHQVAPGAQVVVHRVASTEGLVDELTLARRLGEIGRNGDEPDVVMLAFGGYSVKLGSFGTTGNTERHRGSTRSVYAPRCSTSSGRCPGAVIVASAGNNDSTDPCYPGRLRRRQGLRRSGRRRRSPRFVGLPVGVQQLRAMGERQHDRRTAPRTSTWKASEHPEQRARWRSRDLRLAGRSPAGPAPRSPRRSWPGGSSRLHGALGPQFGPAGARHRGLADPAHVAAANAKVAAASMSWSTACGYD